MCSLFIMTRGHHARFSSLHQSVLFATPRAQYDTIRKIGFVDRMQDTNQHGPVLSHFAGGKIMSGGGGWVHPLNVRTPDEIASRTKQREETVQKVNAEKAQKVEDARVKKEKDDREQQEYLKSPEYLARKAEERAASEVYDSELAEKNAAQHKANQEEHEQSGADSVEREAYLAEHPELRDAYEARPWAYRDAVGFQDEVDNNWENAKFGGPTLPLEAWQEMRKAEGLPASEHAYRLAHAKKWETQNRYNANRTTLDKLKNGFEDFGNGFRDGLSGILDVGNSIIGMIPGIGDKVTAITGPIANLARRDDGFDVASKLMGGKVRKVRTRKQPYKAKFKVV